MSVFEIYLLTRLAAFYEQAHAPIGWLFASMIVCLIAVFICKLLFHADNKGEELTARLMEAWFSKGAKVSMYLLAALWIIRALCPSGKDIAIILGLAWATNSEQASKLPDKVVTVINGYLDDYLDDLEKDIKDKVDVKLKD